MKIILKIRFDNSFYVFLLLILITGLFKEFSFIFILLIFHEFGHALMGIFFKWNLISITIYPYGGLTLFDKLENSSILKEIIILLAGPSFQTITYLILSYFFKYDYIRGYHFSLLIFNMLPILTLDGGRLLNLILNKFFNYLTSFYISVFISFFTIIILIFICLFNYYNLNLLFMSVFLFFKVIKSIKNIKYCYHRFLLERYLYNFNFKNYKIVDNIYNFYMEKTHFIKFQNEKKYLQDYFCNYGIKNK